MSGQLVRLRVHNLYFELKFNCMLLHPYYQGVHKSKVFKWPELTLLGGFHFRGGDTPSFWSRRGCCVIQGMVFRVLSLPHYFASLTGSVFELEAFKRVCVKAASSMKLV